MKRYYVWGCSGSLGGRRARRNGCFLRLLTAQIAGLFLVLERSGSGYGNFSICFRSAAAVKFKEDNRSGTRVRYVARMRYYSIIQPLFKLNYFLLVMWNQILATQKEIILVETLSQMEITLILVILFYI